METELKLELDRPLDPEVRQRLAAAYGSPLRKQRLISFYFDTDDRRLWGAGVTLRVRHDGGRRIQTIKVERDAAAGLFSRPEWECGVSGDRPEFNPETRAFITGMAGASMEDLALEVRFVTDVERWLWRIDLDGAELELVGDSGVILAHGRSARINEIEIELKAGPPRTIFDLAARIEPLSPLRIGVRSKAERGHALDDPPDAAAVKAGRVALTGDHTVQAALQAICHTCLRHYRLNETPFLEVPQAETLHQCRVALRRLRSALDLFGPVLDDPESKALDARLGLAARMFADGRTIDVLIEQTRNPDLLTTLKAHRKTLYDALIADLHAPTVPKLLLDVAAWTSTGTWLSRPETADLRGEAIRPFAVRRLRRCRTRLKRRGAHLADTDAAGRHSIRIAAKKLRYSAEFLGGLFPRPKAMKRREACLAAVAQLQTELGEMNDQVTGMALLGRLEQGDVTPWTSVISDDGPSIKSAVKAYRAIVDLKPFWADARAE